MRKLVDCAKRMCTGVRVSEHREAKSILSKIDNNKSNYCAIHYSCQSFYDNDTGLLPRITSIAVCDLDTWQAQSFSIHITAALLKIPFDKIPENYDQVEEVMLREYFGYLKSNEKLNFVHWNMRDGNFGFKAIELRGQLLCPDAVYVVPNGQKIDVSRLFIKLYGKKYISHPQFASIIEKNYKLPRYFMDGESEAKAFDDGEYVKLHQSTQVKVSSLSKLLSLAADNDLKTDATWKDTYGLSVDGILTALGQKWYGKLIFWLFAAIAGGIITYIVTDVIRGSPS